MALVTVRDAKGIGSFKGRTVKLVGKYRIEDVGKGPRSVIVSKIELPDGAEVVAGYSPSSKDIDRFNDQPVGAIGRLHWSCPDETQHYIVAPHLIDIEVMDIERL